ncbi:MAG: PKD domain-containing protein [Planctomycetota bacterium]
MRYCLLVFSVLLVGSMAAGENLGGAFRETPPPGSTVTRTPIGRKGADGGGSATSSDLTSQMPPVMNQGGINSCVSCAVGYAEKSFLEALSSTTFCPNYLYNQINGGVDTGSYVTDNYYVLAMRGITKSSDQTYDATPSHATNWPTQTQCELAASFRNVTPSSFSSSTTIAALDFTSVKTQLASGPVILGLMNFPSFASLHATAGEDVYFYPPTSGSVSSWHCITIIGFDDSKTFTNSGLTPGAFKIQNSWGTTWGTAGYAWIPYQSIIDRPDAFWGAYYYGASKANTYVPVQEAMVRVSHAKRGRIAITIGVGSTSTPDWSMTYYSNNMTVTSSGNLNDETHADISTTLDVTEGAAVTNCWPPSAAKPWWVKVTDSKTDTTTGTITQFTLIDLANSNTLYPTISPLPVAIPDNGSAYAFVSPPTTLVYVTQPADSASGVIIPGASTGGIKVKITDGTNTIVNSNASVTLAVKGGTAALRGTTTVAAVNGIATFSDLIIDKSGTGYILTATCDALSALDSSTFAIAAGAPKTLAFAQNPVNMKTSDTLDVIVNVLDTAGNIVTGSTATVTISIGQNPSTGTLSGTVAAAAVAGVSEVTGGQINRPGDGYTLVAKILGTTPLVTGTSLPFSVTPGDPTQLVYLNQPVSTPAGKTMPKIRVAIEDAFNNICTSLTDNVTLTFGTDPTSGTAVLSGGTATAAVAGIATFSAVSIDIVATGYTLSADTATPLTKVSSAFSATAGLATQLKFKVQPSNAVAGVANSPAVQVEIDDANGVIQTTSTASVTLALQVNTTGGVISGTTTVAAVAGIATFSNLKVNKVGTGYTLIATASGLDAEISSAFNITESAVTGITFVSQPKNITGGATLPDFAVQYSDAFGNAVTATSATNVVLSIVTPTVGTLTGTKTVATSSGVATFSGLSIDKAGTYTLKAVSGSYTANSASFAVTVGAPAGYVFSGMPTTQTAGISLGSVKVSIVDAGNNLVTTATSQVTLAIGNDASAGTNAVLSGVSVAQAVAGAATFSNLSIDKPGTGYTLSASGNLTTKASSAFNITVGPASKLVFTTQPVTSLGGATLTPVVKIQDAGGNTISSATTAVTLKIGTNPSNLGTLAGTLTMSAVAGVADFSSKTVRINQAGSGYTLIASATGLPNVTSTAFNITIGSPTALAFTAPPSNTVAGNTFSPVVVGVVDAANNVIADGTQDAVATTLTLVPDPGASSAALQNAALTATVAGKATFSTLSETTAYSAFVMHASASSLTDAVSPAFAVIPRAPDHLGFLQQPANVVSNSAVTAKVAIADQYGNICTSSSAPISVILGANTPGGTLTGTTTIPAVAGVANFTSLAINKVGTGYTLLSSMAGLNYIESNTFNVTASTQTNKIAKVVFATPIADVAAKVAIPDFTVQLQDAIGNVVNVDGASVALALTTPNGAVLTVTSPATTTAGVATFSATSIDKLGSYSLKATYLTLTGSSTTFNVVPGTPTQLLYTAQPAAGTKLVAGANLSGLTLTLKDANNNVCTNATGAVSIDFKTGCDNGATLLGTKSINVVSGVAIFPDLHINVAALGYKFTASYGALTPVSTTNAFDVVPAVASSLVFTTPPSASYTADQTIAPVVTAYDTYGNTATQLTTSIALTIGSNPGAGKGVLSGTATKTPVAGVATFTGLKIDKAGTGYTLVATSGNISVVSSAFDITIGAAAKLGFTVQPAAAVSGATLADFVVAVQDASGNTITTDSTSSIAVVISGSSPPSITGTTTVTAASGLATLTGLSITTAGTFTLTASASGLTSAVSASVVMSVGAPTHMAFSPAPATKAAGLTMDAVKVQILDANNNVVPATTSITVAIGQNTTGGVLAGTTSTAAAAGIATFGNLSIKVAGTYSLVATAPGLPSVESNTFVITIGAPTQLVFLSQPSVTGTALSSVQVALEDASGNVTTATDNIVMSLVGTGTPTLGGTKTVAMIAGTATFSDLTVVTAGSYTLKATYVKLTTTLTVSSTGFSVAPGAFSVLSFTAQPTAGTKFAAGAALTSVTVTAKDANGNVIPTPIGVTLAIKSGSGANGATLSGTLSAVTVNGVATFSPLSIDKVSATYKLQATSGAVTSSDSNVFEIIPGAATALAFTVPPVDTVIGSAISPAVKVTITDTFGNVVTNTNTAVSIVLNANPGAASITGGSAIPTLGVATFSTLKVTKTGVGYTLKAMAGTLSVISAPFNSNLVNGGGTGNDTTPPTITSNLTLSASKNVPFSTQVTASGAQPMTFTLSNLPSTLGLSFGTDTLSGVPAVTGQVLMTLTATNKNGSDTRVVVLNVGNTDGSLTPAPTILSLPSMLPPQVQGSSVAFAASASDSASSLISYSWNFGDGTSANGSSVNHIFAAAGIYTATLTVSNGMNSASQQVTVTITTKSAVLTVNSFALALNFAKPGSDSLKVAMTCTLPTGISAMSQNVSVTVGSCSKVFTLSATGAGKLPGASLAVSEKSHPAQFVLTLSKQSLAACFSEFPNANVTGVSQQLPVVVTIGNSTILATEITVTYNAKAGKSGVAK